MNRRPFTVLKRDGVTFTWNGRFIKRAIAEGAREGLVAAGKLAVKFIKEALTQTIGSEVVSGNRVKAVKFSEPGTFPHAQTENYANSWDSAVEKSGFDQILTIFSRDEKASILELGGFNLLNTDNEFTNKVLVNPIPVLRYIAPRPVLQPVVNQLSSAMVREIEEHIRKSIDARVQ